MSSKSIQYYFNAIMYYFLAIKKTKTSDAFKLLHCNLKKKQNK